jgi:hypothetical protein
MKARFPEFTKIATQSGGVIYRKQFGDTKYLFCLLCISPKIDRFTLELAMSPDGHFPFDIWPGDWRSDGAIRMRIGSILSLDSSGWWNVNASHEADLQKIIRTSKAVELAKAREGLPSLVEEAIEALSLSLPKFVEKIVPDNNC